MVTRGCKTLQQLSRKISQFKIEHKVFKQFRFRDHEHHQTLLWHAKYLSRFLVAMSSPVYYDYGPPYVDENGVIHFQELDRDTIEA